MIDRWRGLLACSNCECACICACGQYCIIPIVDEPRFNRSLDNNQLTTIGSGVFNGLSSLQQL
jgi:hypothetical protein